jgi:hypothetical protein
MSGTDILASPVSCRPGFPARTSRLDALSRHEV